MTTTSKTNLELLAHLMRRVGFGSTLTELKELAEKSYEDTVNNLVYHKETNWIGEYLIRRFDTEASGMINPEGSQRRWMYRMVTSDTPLQERMTLFWHGIFATGRNKVLVGKVLSNQIDTLRENSLTNLDNILLQLAKDPAMIIWLDNQENHKNSINENWGRELLELFSMGVGNYTEDDIKECARAFTGWSIGNVEYMMERSSRASDWPYGRIAYHYEFKNDDNDKDNKKFLGHEGPLSGEDIIKIICSKESTARFIARHMYHSFVEDEVEVSSWNNIPPKNPEAIQILVDAYFKYNHDIREMLRILFNSDFFKSPKVRYARIKSPAELSVGLLKLSQEFTIPHRDMLPRNNQVAYMGQALSDPPSVEGWHEGTEWIDTGTLMERINFASATLGNINHKGINDLVNEIKKSTSDITPNEKLVQTCANNIGLIELSDDSLDSITKTISNIPDVTIKILTILRLIGTSREFQRA